MAATRWGGGGVGELKLDRDFLGLSITKFLN